MPAPLSLDALQVLDAIDRRKSFAGAAQELHRVPSAISYTVQKLEEDMGIILFDRSGHRATLTPTGQFLLEQGRHLLLAANRLVHATRQFAKGWEPRLVIGLNTLLPASALAPLLSEFHALGQPVDVKIVEEVLTGCWEALDQRRADLMVGADTLTRPPGPYHTQPLGEIEMVYAVNPNHPLAACEGTIPGDEIARYPGITIADSSRILPPSSAGLFQQQRRITVPSMDMKIELQLLGVGGGYLPWHRARPLVERGLLVVIQPDPPRNRVPVCLARRDEDGGLAMDWFWQKLSHTALF